MLPRQFKPQKINNLVRVGPAEDGGYVLPQAVLEKTQVLFGLGVCDDWRFEEEFRERANCQVICYDHTVNAKFWVKTIIACGSKAVFGVDTKRNLRNLLKPLQYKKFFNGKTTIHKRIKVGFPNQNTGGVVSQSIDQIIQPFLGQNVFFKIDIEGWEYRILDQLGRYPECVLGFVIEFHDVDLHQERLQAFIGGLECYVVAHIHSNNYGSIDTNGNPTVLEITFVRKDLIEDSLAAGADRAEEEDGGYPVKDIDFPNNPKEPDFVLKFAK